MEQYSIKALRVNNKLTCKNMAELLGITKQAYSYKENGKRKFTANELCLICNHLGISDLRKIKL